ncbi:MAG: VWA domain-containing protein [Firmicutes bacterium]|nr:VWA domain-containing protein [Bacillota bacterium]
MKKGLTELVFILDRSGSMGGMESDTIGGFNGFLAKQKKEEGECLVSTVLFDNYTETVHDRIDLKEVKDLSSKEYYVRGSTALLDALGGSIDHISTIQKYAREEDRPEHTIFVITTDGLENASRRYTYDKVRAMVNEKQEKGWQFIFMAANIDAVKEARRYGIAESNAVTYVNDKCGSDALFESADFAVRSLRMCGSVGNWKAAVEKDNKRRGK